MQFFGTHPLSHLKLHSRRDSHFLGHTYSHTDPTIYYHIDSTLIIYNYTQFTSLFYLPVSNALILPSLTPSLPSVVPLVCKTVLCGSPCVTGDPVLLRWLAGLKFWSSVVDLKWSKEEWIYKYYLLYFLISQAISPSKHTTLKCNFENVLHITQEQQMKKKNAFWDFCWDALKLI